MRIRIDGNVLPEQNTNMQSVLPPPPAHLDRLRARVSRIERRGFRHSSTLPFGIPAIDDALPGGGLAMAALHEVIGTGVDVEFAAAPALFAAGLLARRPGPVLWVLQRRDLVCPGAGGDWVSARAGDLCGGRWGRQCLAADGGRASPSWACGRGWGGGGPGDVDGLLAAFSWRRKLVEQWR